MSSTAYIAATGSAQNIAGTPKPSAHIGDIDERAKGKVRVSRDWWRYLLSFASAPAPEQSVTIGASPTTFKASVNGRMLVQGGTVSAIQLVRQSTYSTGLTSGYIPLSIGDQLTVTYSVAPTLTWFPI